MNSESPADFTCTNCAAELGPEAVPFCPACGSPQGDVLATPSAPAAPPPLPPAPPLDAPAAPLSPPPPITPAAPPPAPTASPAPAATLAPPTPAGGSMAPPPPPAPPTPLNPFTAAEAATAVAAMAAAKGQPPAWLADPMRRSTYRYWNGRKWTDQVSHGGVTVTDPAGAKGRDLPPPSGNPAAAANWYHDPAERHQFRYWNGRKWTAQVADNGVVSDDAPTYEGV